MTKAEKSQSFSFEIKNMATTQVVGAASWTTVNRGRNFCDAVSSDCQLLFSEKIKSMSMNVLSVI
jgi:hypothetical protein